jgi:MFS transporter, putative metabolite:H+ symporter
MPSDAPLSRRALALAITVAALGYFVDIYDLILFSIVRVRSLTDLGVAQAEIFPTGVKLLNMQMTGMLIGGLLWGVLGDKRGRLSVLFGTIVLYSAANLLNAAISTVPQYAILRFIAGVGLAGELGAGITLVSELMPRESRGYATSLVAAFGILGAAGAFFVGDRFSWRAAFVVGGIMGIALLALRVGVRESGMFEQVKTESHARGHFMSLFTSWHRASRYVASILIGVPIWYVVGILITFSPEFGREMGVMPVPDAGKAVTFTYLGLSSGGFLSGWISQVIKNRRRVLALFIGLTALGVGLYFAAGAKSSAMFYWLCFGLGIAGGYWSIFITVASEQFGTNLRATVTTTVPNFVRGAVVPLTESFRALAPSMGLIGSGVLIGIVTISLAAVSVALLDETYGRDLNFVEK